MTVEQIKAEIRSFSLRDWVIVAMSAIIFAAALKAFWAAALGTGVGFILAFALRRMRKTPGSGHDQPS